MASRWGVYDWIKSWRTPRSVKILFDQITAFIWSLTKQLVENEIIFLTSSIITEGKKKISGPEKLQNVLKSFRARFESNNISTKALTLFIDALVIELTEDEAID